jgi:hypothetical protein
MTSRINRTLKLNTLRMPHGFCTAPNTSFHRPKLPASRQKGSIESPINRPWDSCGKTIRNITVGRKVKAGIIVRGAATINVRSLSFKVISAPRMLRWPKKQATLNISI